ncbi:hypothetical protein BLNAU_12417 [Blattamonas nauphoetae]|uniref:Uncharacterized protein n=1 Tax=Blattamonas nauphoetae TaxID=2049346 RepID=A0ABQ9XM56_9EUKA|nr:hypothetical protein BLNAU_12417 [Blattamonas nauphoetae]
MQFIITPFLESRRLSAHTDPTPAFSLFDCEIHSDFNPTSPLPHTIHIVPPPVDADGRLIDISRISILPFTKFTIHLPVIPPSEPIRSSTSSQLRFPFSPSTSTSSDPTHILLPKCDEFTIHRMIFSSTCFWFNPAFSPTLTDEQHSFFPPSVMTTPRPSSYTAE